MKQKFLAARKQWREWRPTQSLSYLLFVITALAVGLFCFQHLERLDSSECYRQAITVSSLEEADALVDGGCGAPFDEVAGHFEEQSALADDDATEDEALTATSGRAWLLTWTVMLASTAGILAGGAVSSVHGAISRASADWRGFCWGAAAVLVGVPLALIALGLRTTKLGAYESLHAELSGAFSAVLVAGALTCASIVAIGHAWRRGTGDSLTIAPIDRVLKAQAVASTSLTMLSAGLTAGILATAARWKMIEHLPGAEPLPPAPIVLYGALFTALVAALSVPTQSRLQRALDQSIDLVTCSKDLGPYSTTVLGHKKAIRDEIAQRSSTGVATGAISVLAPLSSAAIAALVG